MWIIINFTPGSRTYHPSCTNVINICPGPCTAVQYYKYYIYNIKSARTCIYIILYDDVERYIERTRIIIYYTFYNIQRRSVDSSFQHTIHYCYYYFYYTRSIHDVILYIWYRTYNTLITIIKIARARSHAITTLWKFKNTRENIYT